ncbi:MFS transporter [Pelobium sp.]|nr:MFS transporter [Pelobium sp.]MDA9555135.1 MFS transporter [Pelobium sp.]
MISKNKQRIFLGIFFFLAGFSFSSWASRIPSIKTNFNFNDAELGTLLLVMPISSLMGLPFSGWLVSRFNSRYPLTTAFIFNAIALILIGFANHIYYLVPAIFLFAFTMRILNIAINTQAINLQKQFEHPIMGTFHGLWSAGGITGISFTTLILNLKIPMPYHLIMIGSICVILTILSFQYLIKSDKSSEGNKLKLSKPDPYLVYLGLLAFFAAVCEGGMFDWSGVYFKEVLHVPIFTYGYLIFMTFMASFRFISDLVVRKIGLSITYIISAILIMLGILTAVLFTSFWSGIIGFSLVGIGTASVVPMTYGLAGKSQKYNPGIAISVITTYTIFGLLIGPPIIGYLSHALNLRLSFLFFVLSGSMLIPISQLFFRYQKKQDSI